MAGPQQMVKAGRHGIIIHHLSTNATDVVDSLVCNRQDFRVLLVEDQIMTESKNSILPRKMLPGPASRPLTGSPSGFACCKPFPSNFPSKSSTIFQLCLGRRVSASATANISVALTCLVFPYLPYTSRKEEEGRVSIERRVRLRTRGAT